MEAQGYEIEDSIMYQDNQSSILLEKNGKASSSKRTKHVNIRYFFITDRINKDELTVEWCPTVDMIGDFATKPLQGALSRKFRDQIMGVVTAKTPDNRETEATKESKNSKDGKQQSLVQTSQSLAHRSVLGERAARRTGTNSPGLMTLPKTGRAKITFPLNRQSKTPRTSSSESS